MRVQWRLFKGFIGAFPCAGLVAGFVAHIVPICVMMPSNIEVSWMADKTDQMRGTAEALGLGVQYCIIFK